MTARPALEQEAEDRLLDAALGEVLREPLASVHDTVPAPVQRLLAAAILLLGMGVLLFIGLHTAEESGVPGAEPQWQEPQPPLGRVENGAALARLDRTAQNLWCVLLPRDLPLLAEFTGLRRMVLEQDGHFVHLQGADRTWSLEPLARCKHLTSLTIGNLDGFRPEQLECLTRLPELRELGLIGVNHLVNAEFVAVLQKLQLRSLSLSGTGIDAAGCTTLCGLPLLERLSLRDCMHLDRCDLRQLRHLMQLRSLALRGVGGQLADSLSKSHPLPDEPVLPEPPDPPGAMRTGLRMPGLTSLQLTGEVMRAIATLPQLRELDLQNSVVDDAGMAVLPRKLEALDLGDVIGLSTQGVASVACLPNLWRFGFSDTRAGTVEQENRWRELQQFVNLGHPGMQGKVSFQEASQRALQQLVRERRFTKLVFRGTITNGIQEALLTQSELVELELVFLGRQAALDLGFTQAMPRLERLTITNAPDFDPAPLGKLEMLRLVQLNRAPACAGEKVRKVVSERVQVRESSVD